MPKMKGAFEMWDSPASKGAYRGPGPVPGAGELDAPGSHPGSAGMKKFRNFDYDVRNTPARGPGPNAGSARGRKQNNA